MKATDIGKYLWRIFVILLLNILVIVMVSGYEPFASFASQDASEDSAQEVLSKYGSQGEEVRQIQTKLKELGLYRRHLWQRHQKRRDSVPKAAGP